MIVFPPCKINLGLQVRHKRPDGFHELATIFYPIPFTDALEIIRHPDADAPAISFQSTGIPVEGDPAQNLCVRAAELIRDRFPNVPPILMHLHKVIPTGAGLGGGSSDGAHTLMLLKRLFDLPLEDSELHEMALRLGSDCPFFLEGKPVLAFGRGEEFEPINLSLSGYQLVLIHPGIHVSTANAFKQLNRGAAHNEVLYPFSTIIQQPVNDWPTALINDFEIPVFEQHPLIGQLKAMLYRMGASYASMSGSGSAVFGIFPPNASISLEADPEHRVFQCRL